MSIDKLEEFDKIFIPFKESLLSQIELFEKENNCKVMDFGNFDFRCYINLRNSQSQL